MTNPDDLHARLDDLNARILKTREALKGKDSWHDGHHLTSGELRARYEYLKSKVDADIKDLTVHGHHVSQLEKAVMHWLEVLDT